MMDGGTHWEGCWREHLECAVARAEKYEAAIRWAVKRMAETPTGFPFPMLSIEDKLIEALGED